MALVRPPQHRVDAEPVYIDVTDDAWDREGLNAEFEEIDRENKRREEASNDGVYEAIPKSEHPYLQYVGGKTRFDLEAPCFWRGQQKKAADYLSGDATRFVLRRLDWRDYYRVRSAFSRDVTEAFILACRLGLRRIDGDSKFRVDPDLPERSDDEMRRLFELNPEIPISIGRAVWLSSQPLTDAEKKAFAP